MPSRGREAIEITSPSSRHRNALAMSGMPIVGSKTANGQAFWARPAPSVAMNRKALYGSSKARLRPPHGLFSTGFASMKCDLLKGACWLRRNGRLQSAMGWAIGCLSSRELGNSPPGCAVYEKGRSARLDCVRSESMAAMSEGYGFRPNGRHRSLYPERYAPMKIYAISKDNP